MTALMVIGMVVLILLGCFFLLMSFSIGFGYAMFSGHFESICLLPLVIGCFLIWLACHLSPFNITVMVAS